MRKSPSALPAPRRYLSRSRKLSAEQAGEIQALTGQLSLRALAARFGVSHETVRRILRDTAYRDGA